MTATVEGFRENLTHAETWTIASTGFLSHHGWPMPVHTLVAGIMDRTGIDAEELKDVKAGKWTLGRIERAATEGFALLAAAQATIPSRRRATCTSSSR